MKLHFVKKRYHISMYNKFWLTLGGWAARWIAHIGIIRYLEQLWVSPIEISWTSIGAIIGALYANGMSSYEMEEIAEKTQFLTLLDFDLNTWLIKGNKIIKYFEKYLWNTEFKDLKIPLSIVATDIDGGNKIIFREWKILDAIRASIWIPGIFSTYKHNGMHLVDGWIMENLPIQAIQDTEKIIAISVQMNIAKKITKKKSLLFPNGTMFTNSYNILRKTIGIMMYQNELQSIRTSRDVILIRIGREDIDYYQFNKIKPLITEWYNAAISINLKDKIIWTN